MKRIAFPTALLGLTVLLAVALPATTRADVPATMRYSLRAPMVARDGGPVPIPYPAGTTTGIASLDAVLAALESDSPASFKTFFDQTPSPCVIDPHGITNPPLCPSGTPAGSLVPVFRASTCEAVWPDNLEEMLQYLWDGPRPVVAIYRDVPEAYHWLPAADYAVIVLPGLPSHVNDPTAEGRPAVIGVKEGRVNGILFGCGHKFSELTAGVAQERFVLPPR